MKLGRNVPEVCGMELRVAWMLTTGRERALAWPQRAVSSRSQFSLGFTVKDLSLFGVIFLLGENVPGDLAQQEAILSLSEITLQWPWELVPANTSSCTQRMCTVPGSRNEFLGISGANISSTLTKFPIQNCWEAVSSLLSLVFTFNLVIR